MMRKLYIRMQKSIVDRKRIKIADDKDDNAMCRNDRDSLRSKTKLRVSVNCMSFYSVLLRSTPSPVFSTNEDPVN